MQIIFTTNNLPFSILIRAITSCEWSHVAIAFGDTVYEARFGGVSKTTFGELIKRGKYKVVNVSVEDEKAAELFAQQQVGKKYDFMGLIAYKMRENWQDAKKWYCSEYIVSIAEAGKTKLVRDGLRGVSPRDLWVLPL